MNALCSVLVAVLGIGAGMEPLVLENGSPQPVAYQFHHGFDAGKGEPWTAPQTLPTGARRTVLSPVVIVIRYQHGADWTKASLEPGKLFSFRRNSQGQTELNLCGALPPAADLREVKVLAVADIEYRNRFPQWQDRVKRLVASASRVYESEFRIRFRVVDCKPWEFNARYQQSDDEKLVSLQKIELGQADLMIAFIRSVADPGGGAVLGWALRLSEYVVVADSWPELAYVLPLAHREEIWKIPDFGSTVVLVHELCHTLGGFHVDNIDSIMCPQPYKAVPPRIQFDDFNRQVLLATRNVDFRQGAISVPHDAALQIRELYLQHRLLSEPAEWDPISSAFGYRWKLATLSQNRPLANQMAYRAATWWRPATAPEHSVGYLGSAGASPNATELARSVAGSSRLAPQAAPAKPQFTSLSNDPVQLRYRFASGDRFSIRSESKSLGEAVTPEGKRVQGGSVALEIQYVVKELNANGNALIAATVTRATVRNARTGRAEFDSVRDLETREARFVPFSVMINRPVTMAVSPAGRIVEAQVRSLTDEIQLRGGDLAQRYAAPALDRALCNNFFRLPETSIKSGDRYDCGASSTRLPDGGVARTPMSLRLSAVSGDKKLALLDVEPGTSFQLPGKGQPKTALEHAEVSGWTLFDIQRGVPLELFRRATWSGTLVQGLQSVKINEVTDTRCVWNR